MTDVDSDRIAMADADDCRTLDMMYEWLEPAPEGFKVEIVSGNVYLIVDPYTGTWHLHTLPKEDEYRSVLSLDFGTPVDLTSTVVGLSLATDAFPRG
ncbi:hypothetical protein PV689_24970 [Streptomyces sp. ATCC51928]|uniref:Uncharacterized protein n=1 Tax=Streptomyces caviscabies TaxID=90079 RepID=A0ABW2MD96_9ACTN|nr:MULTISPECIES: hypothetical protein [unclassified Streptomyces]MDX3505182.1 hypothetical protein [Streptomyces sp. ATCC51928]MDX5524625.1 hypothetical protein [Streptomyces sp. DE06-01C]